jgi:hypothetical protein
MGSLSIKDSQYNGLVCSLIIESGPSTEIFQPHPNIGPYVGRAVIRLWISETGGAKSTHLGRRGSDALTEKGHWGYFGKDVSIDTDAQIPVLLCKEHRR